MWEVEHLDGVADQLQREFPTCGEIEPLSVLGYGFSSLVIESANGYVFLIARNGVEKYASAISFLKQVDNQLPVTVPRPKFPKPHILGYPKLSGISLDNHLDSIDLQQLSIDVANFMVTLHSLAPLAEQLPAITWQEQQHIFHQRRTDTSKIIRELMTAVEATTIDDWWELFLTDERMAVYESVAVHGDLWYGNMLIDENRRLTAVIDWECVALTDPALDFVPQIYLGEAFDKQVMDAYQRLGGTIDQHLSYRVDQLRIVREFDGLQTAIALDDQDEIVESIDKIRQTPLFT